MARVVADAIEEALDANALHVSVGSFLDLRYLVDSGGFSEQCQSGNRGSNPRSGYLVSNRSQLSVCSKRSSHMSTEARVPGVSEASIALNTWSPAAMSSALSKY